ncbi:hypothetical protein [Cellvibrio sp.]|uniref:hypothetical protein n=1 Tax=Cellvibrio sp. TaxID=1965322 RepID=UPI00396480EB
MNKSLLLGFAFTTFLTTAPQGFAKNTNEDWPIIKRNLDVLYEGQKEFRFLGLAAPNIQAHESQLHPDFSNRFPDEYELRDILSSINRLGARATRSFSFGVYSPKDNGVPFHISGRRQYNEDAFRSFDLLLALCKEYDVRILVPFIASQSFPVVRGVDEFAALSGNTTPGAFWTDEKVKEDFKHFLNYVLNRRNTITGIVYKNDPAILGWQFGNEFDSYAPDRKINSEEWKPIITAWQLEMAKYIKSIDSNHLLMEAGGDRHVMLNSPDVDMMSAHLYEYWNRTFGGPTELAPLAKKERDASRGKKVLLIDEFGLATIENQTALIKAIREEGISGGLLWSIRSHRRDGGFYYHNEGGTPINSFHIPGFAAGYHFQEQQILDLVKREGYAMRGLKVPPIKKPDQAPVLFSRKKGALVWRGSTGASDYTVERSEKKNGGWKVVATGIQDSVIFDVKKYEEDKTHEPTPLWFDETGEREKTYYYRVKGRNAGGETGYSNVIEMSL